MLHGNRFVCSRHRIVCSKAIVFSDLYAPDISLFPNCMLQASPEIPLWKFKCKSFHFVSCRIVFPGKVFTNTELTWNRPGLLLFQVNRKVSANLAPRSPQCARVRPARAERWRASPLRAFQSFGRPLAAERRAARSALRRFDRWLRSAQGSLPACRCASRVRDRLRACPGKSA